MQLFSPSTSCIFLVVPKELSSAGKLRGTYSKMEQVEVEDKSIKEFVKRMLILHATSHRYSKQNITGLRDCW